MPERRSTLDEVAERMRKSPRWLREKLNAMPTPIGNRLGRLWTFTAAQERDLVDFLHREQCPPALPIGKRQRRSYAPLPSSDDMLEEALRLAREKPKRPHPPRR